MEAVKKKTTKTHNRTDLKEKARIEEKKKNQTKAAKNTHHPKQRK